MATRQREIPADYTQLYELYFNPLKVPFTLGMVRQWVKDVGRHEDLLHDTWIRMTHLDALAKFDPTRGNFGLFVLMHLRSVVFNYLRKEKRTPTALTRTRERDSDDEMDVFSFLVDETEQGESPEDNAVAQAMVDQLVAFTQDLAVQPGASQMERSLWKLLDVLLDGGAAKDVATATGMSPSAITGWRKALAGAVAA